MRIIRLLFAVTLFMIARLFKILCVAISPSDVKEDFRDNI